MLKYTMTQRRIVRLCRNLVFRCRGSAEPAKWLKYTLGESKMADGAKVGYYSGPRGGVAA